MSVAAMTMDDQRPLMNSYDKMPTKYEQNLHIIGGGSGSGGNSSSGGGGGGVGGGMGAPPSGPASPTPSGSEELPPPNAAHGHPYGVGGAPAPHHHHHHHHHHHAQQEQHRHHHHQQQQQQQQQQPQPQQQQQQQPEPQQPPEPQQQQQHHVAVAEAVAAAEQRQRLLEDEIESLKLEQTRLGQQCVDAQRREKILMRRLANKEQEFQDYVSQIAEYKAQQAPTALALRTALLDPAVNLLFERLKKELKATKAKLEETQNELSAWKFTPDSNTGKRLMAKCRLLYQENEELGKMTSNGRLAKLETELAMQKSFSEEVKKSQSELDDFLQELDEDVEGMQSTILFLQQELKTTRDRIQTLEKENVQLKQVSIKDMAASAAAATNGTANNNNEYVKYQPQSSSNSTTTAATTVTKLETIDEQASLDTTAAVAAPDYYNGSNNNEQTQTTNAVGAAAAELLLPEDVKNGAAARLARKRNYEEEVSGSTPSFGIEETPAAPPTLREVSAPRTLPPKKSKLRAIASRRSSQLEECGLAQSVVSMPVSMPVATPLLGLDNAVAGMASEDVTVAAVVEGEAAPAAVDIEATTATATPGRIVVRRRSVRVQTNGGGIGGIGGGDY